MMQTFYNKDKKPATNMQIDQATIKKKRVLVSTDYTAKAFVSVDFCQANDKLLVTLGDDNRIVVWQYDKQKSVATEVIQLNSPQSVIKQISFSNLNPSVILVTGKDVYKYYHLTDMNQLKCNHAGFNRKDDSQTPAISTNFVCHAWMADGKFVVCTDIGQMLLFETSGDFKNIQITAEKKNPFPINAIMPFIMGNADAQASGKQSAKSGFVIAGDSGLMRVFFKSELDPRTPYRRADGNDDLHMQNSEQDKDNKQVINDVMYHKISNMALSPKQDILLFTTDGN